MMLYSCADMTTVGVKGLSLFSLGYGVTSAVLVQWLMSIVSLCRINYVLNCDIVPAGSGLTFSMATCWTGYDIWLPGNR